MQLQIHHSGQISKQQILNGNYASSANANESESEIQDFTRTSSSNSLTNTERKTENETFSQNLSGNKNSQDNSNELEEYTKIREGYDFKETKSRLIADYRKNIVNIYERIIEDLRPLFFALYQKGGKK